VIFNHFLIHVLVYAQNYKQMYVHQSK